jgi:hypothetical protein
MEVCRHPFDPFIYHGRSVNAHLTLIGGREGLSGGWPAPQTTLPQTAILHVTTSAGNSKKSYYSKVNLE